jgi:anthranilate synthase component II
MTGEASECDFIFSLEDETPARRRPRGRPMHGPPILPIKISDTTMLLMIDNYDSFTYNLVQYLGELGQEVRVFRNDEIGLDDIERLAPDYLMISPGPCTPDEAGISVAAIRHFAGKVPILGVCLGHQSIGQAFGGHIVHARQLMHGKVSPVSHAGQGVFAGLPTPVTCTRYHSLVIERDSLPDCLEITAWTDDGEIMGVRHHTLPVEGVQFHPESILTEHGHAMLDNFLRAHAR